MKRKWSEGLVILRFIFLFSVSLSWDIWDHPPLTTFFYPDVSFKALFVSPRLHWCADYCHSLLLKGRVCNRWSLWSRPTVAASAGWASWQCCWPWNEEDTFRLVKRRLLFFFFFDWHQLGEMGITQRKSELPSCFWINILFPSRISIFYGLHLPTEIRLPFAPIPPLKFMLPWHLVLGGHDSFPVCMALHSYFWSADVFSRYSACNFQ